MKTSHGWIFEKNQPQNTDSQETSGEKPSLLFFQLSSKANPGLLSRANQPVTTYQVTIPSESDHTEIATFADKALKTIESEGSIVPIVFQGAFPLQGVAKLAKKWPGKIFYLVEESEINCALEIVKNKLDSDFFTSLYSDVLKFLYYLTPDFPYLRNSSLNPLFVEWGHVNSSGRIYPGVKIISENQFKNWIKDSNFKNSALNSFSELPKNGVYSCGTPSWKKSFIKGAFIAALTFTSEDLTLIFAGLASSFDWINFGLALMASIIGIFIGDWLLFLLGRICGRSIFNNRLFKHRFKEARLDLLRESLVLHSAKLVISSRFIPGSRVPLYLSAGALGVPASKFTWHLLLGALIWCPIPVTASYLLGLKAIEWLGVFHDVAYFLFFLIILFLFRKHIMSLFSFKQRKLLLSSIRKKIKWEFWPSWAFYPPVVFYILLRSIKIGKLTLFTIVNPGMPSSGIRYESKADILGKLPPDRALSFARLPIKLDIDSKMKIVADFMAREDIDFPVICKPDVGERGKDILRAFDLETIKTRLSEVDEDYIIQKFADGREFGIFYIRYPDKENGFVFSVAEKKMIYVVGDGVSNLEKLILTDSRANYLAEVHLKKWKDKLDHVPENGEKFYIVEIGAHSKGSIFDDANFLMTDALEKEIDKISKHYEGFYLGRFDVRVPHVDDLKAGKNINIIELNGLTGEPADMYTPTHSLFRAYGIIFKVWRHAMNIAEINLKNGAKPNTISELWKEVTVPPNKR